MNDNTMQILTGYMRLTDEEKREFEECLGINRTQLQRKQTAESITRQFKSVNMNPIDQARCKCCGK